jgi:hypothetical protein
MSEAEPTIAEELAEAERWAKNKLLDLHDAAVSAVYQIRRFGKLAAEAGDVEAAARADRMDASTAIVMQGATEALGDKPV